MAARDGDAEPGQCTLASGTGAALRRIGSMDLAALGAGRRLLVSEFLLGQMVADDTSANRTDYRVVARIVARYAADHGAFQAACRRSRTGETCERESQQDERARRFLHDGVYRSESLEHQANDA